ncbi:hypothetical protein ABL78_2868 [Leptomonas seymouri]|uniref:Uncharacterized protein n=1 Tax=Leptomonas seymouri TaxID=5684 RepID=A0A0N1ILN5_LEPSE|nr:hypothetical protein ABL78_2868 [Leptomonas seymouri]|eukprot:KPI88042.1 hypothetical protein ABL78_2868 [Leptomonas seymouri]
MSSAQQQAKKIAWLESMLDRSIAAYEAHRNALVNLYTQLTQWQQPPGTGCIHVASNEVNELLGDINDVLDQCALQLQAFHSDNSKNEDALEASGSPPSSRARNAGPHAYEPQPDSRASSHRGVTHTPSLHSPTQGHLLQRQQQRSPPPAQKEVSPTPSERSHVSQVRVAPSAGAKQDPHEASARTTSDARSCATNESAEHPPSHLQQQQQQRQRPRDAPHQRTASATPSQASSVPPPAVHAEYEAEEAGLADGSPTQLESTARHAARPRQPTGNTSTRSGATQESTYARRGQQPQQEAHESRQEPSRGPTSHGSNTPTPSQLAAPAAPVEAPQRRRMQTCYHHQRAAGLAITPWPVVNNGKDAAAATGGATLPSAAARAVASKDELPAEQYRAYKQRGTRLDISPERRAAAEALERRALEEEEAKEKAVYLPPSDNVADRAAAAARARRSAPTSHGTSQELSLNESQRSRNRQQGQQPQDPRGVASHARAEAVSTAPSSVAVGGDDYQSAHSHQQSQSQVDRSLSSAEGKSNSKNNGVTGAVDIPRRRGSSAAAESEGGRNSSFSSYAKGEGKHDGSQRSHRSQPPQGQQKQQQQHQHQHQHQQPSMAAIPHASSAVGPGSRSAAQHSPTSAQPLQTDVLQSGSAGLVQTPTTTPQRGSTHDVLTALPSQQRVQKQGPPFAESPTSQQAPGVHRPLRTAVPRRTSPRAHDSSQSEDAIYQGRHRHSTGRPPVRTDSPNTLRYMDGEDAKLRQRREEELAEIHKDPLALQQQQQAAIDTPSGLLAITEGSSGVVSRRGEMGASPSRDARGQPAKLTAVEEQLLAERTALHNQLEKLQMEATISTSRNKEWGNERRYSQLNARMSRVMEDLDKVEKELRVVRNLDRDARSESASKAQ